MITTHGFALIREERISELDTLARLYRHERSGATLLSLSNSDENKVFGVTFRTPPSDSTGIAHIMEHSVLGGSQNYPLKEPFVQLVKGSLKTFLNALTYPDRTVYPVASQNLQDLYNLVDVYLDAVFHPLITPQHLMQEGWHYELESLDEPLIYKGVVFNEMKGVYSSPDSLLYRASQQTLFPDNAYGFDSGGDPIVIPQLTYEQFRSFHSTYYHPANALLYFYGDDPEEERLRRLNAVLADFGPAEVDGQVALQSGFEAPHGVVRTFDAEDDKPEAKRGMILLRWLLPESVDEELIMGLSVLSHALVGTQASPLRKKLIDSGLGEELTGGGLSASLRQMTFAVGLKGIDPEDADKVEKLILTTLDELSREGIDPEMVEASLNTIEFSLRENNTGSYPRGLAVMMSAVGGWLYKDDPIDSLGYEAPLNAIRGHIETSYDYLAGLIRRYLVYNAHRATVILKPEPGRNQRMEEEERRQLATIRESLSVTELKRIVDETVSLRELQERPDSREDLAKLPSLSLQDLDPKSKTIPIRTSEFKGAQLYNHDLFTNGIVYLDVGFDLHQVPAHLLPYAKLLGQCLTQMGTETEDYVKLSQRIGRLTGGVYASNYLTAKSDDSAGVAFAFLRGKSTVAHAPDLLDILRDVLLTVRLNNQERFRQIILRAKANLESSLIPSGHSIVNGRLRAAFTTTDWASEQMGGLSYLQTLRSLSTEVDDDWSSVLSRLQEVHRLLVNRNAMLCNITLDDDNYRRVESDLHTFVDTIPDNKSVVAAWQPSVDAHNEGLILPAQVNYVGKGANLYDHGYTLDGSISVITNYVRTSFLWDKVRAQGGAYGAFCQFGRQSGVLTFLSYRDPNLLDTLSAYDQTADFLRNYSLSEDELEKNIIGAIGALDAYQLPDAKGFTSMARQLLDESDDVRQQYREQVLNTSVADVKSFADVLDSVAASGRVVVLGGEDAIQNAESSVPFHTVQRIL